MTKPSTAILEVSMEFKSVIEMLTSTEYVNEATAHNLISNLLLKARIDELTWYLGYNHKAMTRQVWQKTSDRIEELNAQLKAHSNRGDK